MSLDEKKAPRGEPEGRDPQTDTENVTEIRELDQETRDELDSVLHAIADTLTRYLVLPEQAESVIAVYVVFTHLIEYAYFAPILLLSSPEPGCGKTTTLDILGEMVASPLGATNVSPAILYRLVEEQKPTLLLDEVDSTLSQKNDTAEAIRGIMNSGHRRGRNAFVWRMEYEGNKPIPRKFSTFSAKILAGIGSIPSTLRDRSIAIELQRKREDEHVEHLFIREVQPVFDDLRDRIQSVAESITEHFDRWKPEVPSVLSNRLIDNWFHLLSIAEIAGGEWPDRIRSASVTTYSGSSESQAIGAMLLHDLKQLFDQQQTDFLATSEIQEFLNTLETRPWPAFSKGNGISSRDIARKLKKYGVQPTQRRIEGSAFRGYNVDDLKDAFARYVSASDNKPHIDSDHEKSPVTESHVVTDAKYTRDSSMSLQGNELYDSASASRINTPLGGDMPEDIF